MNMKQYPVIDPIATGKNIIRLRVERGMSVRDLQVNIPPQGCGETAPCGAQPPLKWCIHSA